jgi:diguanylate cyclase (GGDEF)-like protein
MIITDPERDTPELIDRYAKAFDPSFLGLSESPEVLARVAQAYGAYYEKEAGGPEGYLVAHTSGVFLVDPRAPLEREVASLFQEKPLPKAPPLPRGPVLLALVSEQATPLYGGYLYARPKEAYLLTTPEMADRLRWAEAFFRGEGVRVHAGLLPGPWALWEVRGARLQALAHQGVKEETLLRVLQEGLPYGQGLAWQVYETGSPLFTARYAEENRVVPALKALDWRTFAALPLPSPGAPRSRRVLVVGQRAERLWCQAEVELLLLACRTLGLGLERLAEKRRHEGVNRLFLDLLEKPLEELYQRVLEEAIHQVPGSEAGSLLVLEEGQYRFKAAVGYDLPALQSVAFSPEDQLLWYGLGEGQARRGEPRIMSQEERNIPEISHRTAPPQIIDTAGRAREIQANLCLPIPYKGEVLAYLNLDNLHDPRAFGEDSLKAARFFAAPLATLLHETRTRRLLEEAALTDPLTGLPNRRAFERAFLEELKRAERYGYPLSLAVMDLRGFKPVNDRLGHAVGDLALLKVAEALQRERRNGDRVFRWGGDEFAALFPHTGKEGATKAALRYARAIEALCFEGLCLGVNIGLATFPEDGTTADALLSAADTRMYQAKARGLPLLVEGL